MQKNYQPRNAWFSWEWERKRKNRRESGGTSPEDVRRREKAVSLDEAVSSWKSSLTQKNLLHLAELADNWELIVGSEIAGQSRPVRLERGKLFIRVRDSIWRSQLFYMKNELLRKIRSTGGGKTVKDLILTW